MSIFCSRSVADFWVATMVPVTLQSIIADLRESGFRPGMPRPLRQPAPSCALRR
jgi:hypothetical protein